MTSRDARSRLHRLFAEIGRIPLLQTRLDDDTINSNRSRQNAALGRRRPRPRVTENFLFA